VCFGKEEVVTWLLQTRACDANGKTKGLQANGKAVDIPTIFIAILAYVACPTAARRDNLVALRSTM
jgi:hypothetical protein